MRYIANTDQQKREMLKEIGVSSFEELIGTIPEEMRFRGELDIPGPLSEAELEEEFADLAKRNADFTSLKPLIGAGAYKHHLPRAIQALLGGKSSTLPTPPINRNSARAPSRRCLSCRPTSPG